MDERSELARRLDESPYAPARDKQAEYWMLFPPMTEVDKKQAEARIVHIGATTGRMTGLSPLPEKNKYFPAEGAILFMGDHPWQTYDEYLIEVLKRKAEQLDMHTPVGYNGIHDKE